MKLDDFLSTKAKCIKELDPRCFNSWDVGETYDISITIQVTDKNNDDICFEPQDFLDHFEPVLDAAENPLQGMKPTPEFEAVEPVTAPRFQAGQKAYCPWLNVGRLVLLESNHADYLFAETVKGRQYFNNDGTSVDVTSHAQPDLFHATQENYELLCKLMPWVNFEAPPKPLVGSDLCRAMLDNGWVSVPCYISDESDYEADNNAFCALIGKFDKCFKELATNYEHEYAVPFDPRTGEPLTESALDE